MPLEDRPGKLPVPMTTIMDRARAAFLGVAVGDALGAPVEFLSLGDIRRRFGAAGVSGYEKAYGRTGAITDDTQMALFKSRMDIAREYADLCEDRETADRVFAKIDREYRLTIKWIRRIAGIDELLDENLLLKTSLARRDPYLDPLNAIQATLLRRYRAEEDPDNHWLLPLLRSVNAIAAGMRNTG